MPLAWSLVRRAGSPPQLAALLHNSAAAAQSELGETARSVVEYEESLALLVKYAPDDPLRWALVNNLALEFVESGQYERGLVLAQDGLAQVEARFDACYPVAGSLRTVLAGSKMAAGHFASARADLEQAVACFGEDYALHTVDAIGGLAEIEYLTGDDAEARRQIERGAALTARHPEAGITAARLDCISIDLDVRAGQLARARQSLVDAEARADAIAGAESKILFNVHTRRALLAHLEHDDTAALAALEHAVKWLKPGIWLTEQGLYFFTRARVLHGLGRDRQVVVAQAERAIDAFRVAGPGFGVRVTEVQDWLAAQPELRAP